MEQKSILQEIRKNQLRQIIFPVLCLLLTGLVLFHLPLFEYFNIQTVDPLVPLSTAVNEHIRYVRSSPTDLYYAGEDYYVDGILTGHYYYQLTDSYCRFYILKPTAGKPAEAYLASAVVTGRIVKADSSTEQLFSDFSEELGWNANGLAAICDPYLLNEAVYFPTVQKILFLLLIPAVLLGFSGLLYVLLLLVFPQLSPAILRLRLYGDRGKLFREAEKDLKDHLLLRRASLALTGKYLIDFSPESTRIIPLQSVLWVFEIRRMRFVPKERHLKMFYTLRITTIAGDTIMIRDREISDINKIEEVLSDRYPNFFYGYSEEHDRMVRYILRENRRELIENRKNRRKKQFSKVRDRVMKMLKK